MTSAARSLSAHAQSKQVRRRGASVVRSDFDQGAHTDAEKRIFSAATPRAVPDAGYCGWRRGVVVSGVRRMNEVNARRARLVPAWVTVFGRVYHLGM